MQELNPLSNALPKGGLSALLQALGGRSRPPVPEGDSAFQAFQQVLTQVAGKLSEVSGSEQSPLQGRGLSTGDPLRSAVSGAQGAQLLFQFLNVLLEAFPAEQEALLTAVLGGKVDSAGKNLFLETLSDFRQILAGWNGSKGGNSPVGEAPRELLSPPSDTRAAEKLFSLRMNVTEHPEISKNALPPTEKILPMRQGNNIPPEPTTLLQGENLLQTLSSLDKPSSAPARTSVPPPMPNPPSDRFLLQPPPPANTIPSTPENGESTLLSSDRFRAGELPQAPSDAPRVFLQPPAPSQSNSRGPLRFEIVKTEDSALPVSPRGADPPFSSASSEYDPLQVSTGVEDGVPQSSTPERRVGLFTLFEKTTPEPSKALSSDRIFHQQPAGVPQTRDIQGLLQWLDQTRTGRLLLEIFQVNDFSSIRVVPESSSLKAPQAFSPEAAPVGGVFSNTQPPLASLPPVEMSGRLFQQSLLSSSTGKIELQTQAVFSQQQNGFFHPVDSAPAGGRENSNSFFPPTPHAFSSIKQPETALAGLTRHTIVSSFLRDTPLNPVPSRSVFDAPVSIQSAPNVPENHRETVGQPSVISQETAAKDARSTARVFFPQAVEPQPGGKPSIPYSIGSGTPGGGSASIPPASNGSAFEGKSGFQVSGEPSLKITDFKENKSVFIKGDQQTPLPVVSHRNEATTARVFGEQGFMPLSSNPSESVETARQVAALIHREAGMLRLGARVTFQLIPETLGRITIQVALVDHTVAARFTVTHAEVRDHLQAHMVDLKAALHQAGLQVDQLQVHVQGGGGSLLAQYYEYQQENMPARFYPQVPTETLDIAQNEGVSEPAGFPGRQGLIDVFV